MNNLKKIGLIVATGLLAGNIALAGGNAADSAQPGTDTWITTKVKASIYSEKMFGNTNPPSVSVTTTNGNVSLDGKVKTQDQKDSVENFIKSQNLDGVKGITNNLVVDPSI